MSIITTNKPKPTCIYHHSGQLDYLLMEGKKQIVKDHLKMIRDTGCITGMASHQPEFIALAEEENWDVDLYFTCFYNLTGRGKKTLTAINGSKGEICNPEDPQKMCHVIKQVKKPCIAYKIFGAGRLCHDKSQIYNAFKFAVMNIKIDDFIMVGVFQKYKNQIKENVEIFSTVLSEKDF